MKLQLCSFVALLCCSVLSFAQQPETPRVALVIGVQNYTAVQPLRHALNDAVDISSALKSKGFTVDLLLDPKSGKEIKDAITRYFKNISKGTVGVIYYSGHATVHQGMNYLIPANADLQNPGDLDDQCVKMDYVMASLNSFDNLNILILDACRTNTFPSFNRDLSKGLASVDAPKGSIVLFAAQPGKVASDGTGRNGLFTSKLLKYIDQPNLDLSDILKKVKQEVLTESKGEQLPSYVDNSLGGDFYFTRSETSGADANADEPSNPTRDGKSKNELNRGAGSEKIADVPAVSKIENVKGEWVISNDITPVQARENAINQAKVEALRKAGVPEHIAESNLSYRVENHAQLKEAFESLTTVNVAGEISEFSITKENKRVNELGNLVYEVWINATVSIHKVTRDPGFNIDVTGLRESYLSPDKLMFDIKPWKEGYLTAFILSGDDSGLLYPNNIEKQQKLEGGKLYRFPKSKALDYEVTSAESVEVNYLLLLYTKQEIPFVQEQTPENILRFIAGIDPAQKCLKTYSFLIKK